LGLWVEEGEVARRVSRWSFSFVERGGIDETLKTFHLSLLLFAASGAPSPRELADAAAGPVAVVVAAAVTVTPKRRRECWKARSAMALFKKDLCEFFTFLSLNDTKREKRKTHLFPVLLRGERERDTAGSSRCP
jgi:hypothetical protein